MKGIERLTLEEKVGQLFILGFQGHSPDRETQGLLDVVRPGGYIVVQRNIDSFDQLFELTGRLRTSSAATPLVGIEQAAGTIDRFKPIFGALPGLRELAWPGVTQARMMGRIIAAELEATGFNLTFAPVVDLDVPGAVGRRETLSWSPERVSELAGIFIEELEKKGIVACIRHFPGQGAASRDPHFGLPTIERPKKFLVEHDVAPFVHLKDAAGMIMVAHARYPAFGGDRPASLSPQIMTTLLRKKLKYGGVIVTSDLTMGAITGLGLSPDTFLEAFEAGADMLLFSQTTPMVVEAFRSIVQATRQSATLRSRLDHSVERILALKARIGPPGRYRPHLKARIARQIVRLHKGVEVVPAERAAIVSAIAP